MVQGYTGYEKISFKNSEERIGTQTKDVKTSLEATI